MQKLLLYIATAMVWLMGSGCSIFLNNSDVNKSSIYYMSLDTMFSDESVWALARAADQAKLMTVRTLIDLGVDVNSTGTQGATPLFWSMRNSSYFGFRMLLELGADPNAEYIIDSGLPITASDNIETIMHSVADMNDPRFLKAALQHGGDPNVIDNKVNKETPIFRIVDVWGIMGTGKDKDMEKIDILLDAGANVDAQNRHGLTPTMKAFRGGDLDLTLFLLERGADYHTIKDHRGLNLVDMVANRAGMLTPEGELERLRVVEWLETRGVVMEKK